MVALVYNQNYLPSLFLGVLDNLIQIIVLLVLADEDVSILLIDTVPVDKQNFVLSYSFVLQVLEVGTPQQSIMFVISFQFVFALVVELADRYPHERELLFILPVFYKFP